MLLSKKTLPVAGATDKLTVPGTQIFQLPEKVIQFGTGVLLRGLPDYFIDKANKQGLFNGRIVVIKSTAAGTTDHFLNQDNLYTQCVKGIENGNLVEEYMVNGSISRVLSAASEWDKILECAVSLDIELIISNTTEVGLQLVKEDIHATPPSSFPAKLLAMLHKRYLHYNGAADKGFVIIPTELIPDNGEKLKSILRELVAFNQLDSSFSHWLETANHFCSSLVDRIVPGRLSPDKQQMTEKNLGYEDELMFMSEPYRLWAIESSAARVHDVLSFSKADAGVIIAPGIHIFRKLKLRLLNGPHTCCCGLAHLSGFKLVREAMDDNVFLSYISGLMRSEIIPAITGNGITEAVALDFSNKVIDRFRNPYIDHAWLSITLQYSSKMKMRNVPILLRYYSLFNRVPSHMTLAFAAYILFMQNKKDDTGKNTGNWNDKNYTIQDEQANFYADRSDQMNTDSLVRDALANTDLWGHDLTALPGFENAVVKYAKDILQNGAHATLQTIV